ncbi:hypothetical protein QYE76_001968 [Lolium multiflorum]|uniref:CCHC-type domain-containing protein n=1 Tax=Lolium multiflorum TaxID=4521 RepID=A0AAD8RMD1_LOLMU|nr:hypothetical protein QYE76_001968 [Lolium multiflorum]
MVGMYLTLCDVYPRPNSGASLSSNSLMQRRNWPIARRSRLGVFLSTASRIRLKSPTTAPGPAIAARSILSSSKNRGFKGATTHYGCPSIFYVDLYRSPPSRIVETRVPHGNDNILFLHGQGLPTTNSSATSGVSQHHQLILANARAAKPKQHRDGLDLLQPQWGCKNGCILLELGVQQPLLVMRTSLPHYYLRHCQFKMILLYEEGASIARGGEEQLDMKMDVKLDKELDMKIFHGRAREEREACAREEEEVQDGPASGQTGRHADAPDQWSGPTERHAGLHPAPTRRYADGNRTTAAARFSTRSAGPRPDRPENKNSADIITWREYEALRNEMRREFRTQDDELRGTVQEISQKLDATNETVTTMTDQMTDIQRSLQALQLAIENLTNQQQQQDEDPDEVPGRGDRPRGWAPLGRHGRGHDEEDGLGKPKFSIPKFEGGADVEEYLTWELKIEKLWRLHNYTEDRKIKLASSEFDGYALRWWDALVRNRQEDGEPPIITWRAMKEAMHSRFVPTNYLRTIYDKLTLLRQGVKTVDEYYMEMDLLMQRGRVRESLEMTMQRFLNVLKYDIKGIVRFHSYTTMNGLLHHAREAESQLAEEAKVKGRATGAGRFTPRAPPPAAPAPSTRSAPYSTPPSKPVSNVSNAKKSESAASTSGSSMSTARNRDMACHTCGGKGHFKRDCPNRKVMIINEDNEYETGDDVDPNAPDDDDYDTDGEDAYPSDARTVVVSQRALNVLPSASTQRCNLFQTKALVGPDKACKVIIDGGSCRNLASKELCTKLKLKYLPHPHPYYIQWLSDNGEMKVNHMVRVEFEIGPYKDSIDFDVVPDTSPTYL